MQRPRFLALIAAASAAIALGPAIGAVALAADPTIIVQRGDTLTGIAKRVNVPMSELIRLNSLADPNRIFAGQELRIGSDSAAAPPAVAPAPTAPSATGVVHVVQRGENLTWIARRYGASVVGIVTANGLSDPGRIYVGQQLVIPGSTPAPATAAVPSVPAPAAAAPAPAVAQTHIIQRGETLSGIARRYGVSVAAIVAANGIADASRIYGGQQLTIPGGTAAAPVGATPAALASAASMQGLMAQRDGVRQMIVEEAAAFGVPTALALAVAWQESGWQQSVVSHAGAVGIMQLMPATAAWVGEAMLGAPVDMNDARQNVRAGVRLLAHYLGRYGGSHELALAAYYQGQRALDLHGIYAISRPYIASVLALEALLGS